MKSTSVVQHLMIIAGKRLAFEKKLYISSFFFVNECVFKEKLTGLIFIKI